MFKSRPSKGFTIIEVMIFLTVSIVVFGGAVVTISRQNSRTAFVQSVRDIDLRLQDVFNDVENGYYPSSNNFSCSYVGDDADINDTISEKQGTNQDCIFIGRAVEFESDGQKMTVSTIVGKRQTGSPLREVTSIEEALPVILEVEDNVGVGQKDINYNSADVEFRSFKSGSGDNLSGLAVISGFATAEGSSLRSGIVRTSLAAILTSAGSFNNGINTMDGTSINLAGSGMILCFQEKGDGRKAEILIAVESQRLATSTIIDPTTGACS